MGCASSKQKRCRHCSAPYSPVPRSYSMHVVHPPQEKGDSYHVVALTSTTLGSLALDSSSDIKNNINAALDIVAAIGNDDDCTTECNGGDQNHKQSKNSEFAVGLIEAKSWSSMIQEKIPKIIPRTPVRTPPGEPETINTWELMAGLEEDDGWMQQLPHRFRSFSFDLSRDTITNPVVESPKLNNHIKPLWLQLADEDSNNLNPPEFDPQVISTFRKSLQQLSPDHPFYLNPSSDDEKHHQQQQPSNGYIKGIIKEKAVMYSTSLRGVRKTYEDCCNVRVILKGIGVRVDERDVSMHSGFKEELKQLLGEGFNGGGLPRVFVGTKYIGGAEEIRRLHEEGKLESLLEDCQMLEDEGCVAGAGACQVCGDIRFVPCETCSGSCKIYYERDDEEDNEEEEEGEYGFQRCPDCNENGLIRCPICCY